MVVVVLIENLAYSPKLYYPELAIEAEAMIDGAGDSSMTDDFPSNMKDFQRSCFELAAARRCGVLDGLYRRSRIPASSINAAEASSLKIEFNRVSSHGRMSWVLTLYN